MTGSIELGKFADMIVLDHNIIQGPADDVAHTGVLLTMVVGKVVCSTGDIVAATGSQIPRCDPLPNDA